MNLGESSFVLKSIKLEVTHRCLLNCIHCSSNANSSDAPVMSFELARDILEQAIKMGVEEVSLSGGEPLLWPEIGQAISLCASAGVRTEVYTSGNIDRVGTAMELLKESGASKVIFSVYAANEDCHDKITKVRGSFQRTMSALDEAIRFKVDVEFHFVPLSINYEQLGDVISLARNKCVKQVSILRFVPQGRGKSCNARALDRGQNLELRLMVERGREQTKIRAGSPYNFLMVNESPKCCAGIDRLTILPDSTIYPCDAFKQVKAHEIVGTDRFSRLDKWPLDECWEKSRYLQAIRDYLRSPFDKPCSDCKYLHKCLSGCLAQKYIANGTLKKAADPMCLHSAFENGGLS